MTSQDGNGCPYPQVWLHWVRQQVRTAVAYELAAGDPRRGPHLHRLPLLVDPLCGDKSRYLRELIGRHAEHTAGRSHADQVDNITEAVLANPLVTVDEPDLTVLLAWRLAQHHPFPPERPDRDLEVEHWDDHECLNPEQLAADLVASGLIAPAWKPGPQPPNGRHAPADPSTRRTRPTTRRPPAITTQLAFPY